MQIDVNIVKIEMPRKYRSQVSSTRIRTSRASFGSNPDYHEAY